LNESLEDLQHPMESDDEDDEDDLDDEIIAESLSNSTDSVVNAHDAPVSSDNESDPNSSEEVKNPNDQAHLNHILT
jgi:hypothetical protein